MAFEVGVGDIDASVGGDVNSDSVTLLEGEAYGRSFKIDCQDFSAFVIGIYVGKARYGFRQVVCLSVADEMHPYKERRVVAT